MMLIILVGVAAILAIIFWEGDDEESTAMVSDVFEDVREEPVKIEVKGLTPLRCSCCGGSIKRDTLTCSYCGTEYVK